MSDAVSLAGRTALVTGAGYGIGREIALRLAEAGAGLVLAGRSVDRIEATAAEIRATGRAALVVPTDVGEPDQVTTLAVRAAEEAGPIDVLVSNSGIAGPTAELWRIDPADWEETLRVNLTGTFLLCRAFLPHMLERRQGSIIVIGSATGKRPLARRTPYAASKLGLVGLVRSLAWEVGPHGVRVNLISPGPVEGERINAVIERQAAATGRAPSELMPGLAAGSPLKRLTKPTEVADAVVFLAGDSAQGITGEDLNVSSGWVMY